MSTVIRINGEKVVIPPSFQDEAKQFPTSIMCNVCGGEFCLEFQGTNPISKKPCYRQTCDHTSTVI